MTFSEYMERQTFRPRITNHFETFQVDQII